MKAPELDDHAIALINQSAERFAGVDEAGRGPLAGPVVTAAVILNPEQQIDGINDSKKLTEKKREQLIDEIKNKSLAWAIGMASVEEIDQLNIYHATMLAMQRAVSGLKLAPVHVYVDGNKSPGFAVPSTPVVKGDGKISAIGAASIIAKVTRDRLMLEHDAQFPQYGFKVHKGYPTKKHMEAIAEHGVTPIHRRSYKPIKALLEGSI